ncbi:MAG: hypothetical protein POELPBGB_03015 [Bacteroidia bacterium]|nr:hypothetical protein [Bacteroidia bacterium]
MEKHDLLHEFPQHKEKIHNLKVSDHHFRKLFDEYDAVNNDIHRIETGAEATADEVLDVLRTKRVYLKDQLFEYLK